jgi:hypothetical protein
MLLNGAKRETKLIYRESRDGFTAEDFHSRCDNKGETVIIVKSVTGKVYGGYTDISWKPPFSEYRNGNSFIF